MHFTVLICCTGSTIVGYKAAPTLENGNENVAIGLGVLPNLRNGDANVAIGTFAGHLEKDQEMYILEQVQGKR
jgi:hypothetical protein